MSSPAETTPGFKPLAPCRIGLVEDDPVLARRLVQALQQPGWTLAWQAAGQRAALAAMALEVPDVLLVDLGLPDGHGGYVIRQALARRPDCQPLVISVFGDEASVLDAVAAGACGYLVKGQGDDDIVGHMQHLMEGGSPMSPAIARQLLLQLRGRLPPSAPSTPAILPMPGAETLTEREHDVLRHIARGYTYDEVAAVLGISVNTVRHHVKQIYAKLAVRSRGAAVYEAQQRGWLRLPHGRR